jgi:hypothetical protein
MDLVGRIQLTRKGAPLCTACDAQKSHVGVGHNFAARKVLVLRPSRKVEKQVMVKVLRSQSHQTTSRRVALASRDPRPCANSPATT